MDKRTETAMKVLVAGGYFRRQLETAYRGEKFKYRLKDAEGRTIRGIGFATFSKLEAHLKMRNCERSSSWPMEWELRNHQPVAEPELIDNPDWVGSRHHY